MKSFIAIIGLFFLVSNIAGHSQTATPLYIDQTVYIETSILRTISTLPNYANQSYDSINVQDIVKFGDYFVIVDFQQTRSRVIAFQLDNFNSTPYNILVLEETTGFHRQIEVYDDLLVIATYSPPNGLLFFYRMVEGEIEFQNSIDIGEMTNDIYFSKREEQIYVMHSFGNTTVIEISDIWDFPTPIEEFDLSDSILYNKFVLFESWLMTFDNFDEICSCNKLSYKLYNVQNGTKVLTKEVELDWVGYPGDIETIDNTVYISTLEDGGIYKYDLNKTSNPEFTKIDNLSLDLPTITISGQFMLIHDSEITMLMDLVSEEVLNTFDQTTFGGIFDDGLYYMASEENGIQIIDDGKDTDEDGFSDQWELKILGTNPFEFNTPTTNSDVLQTSTDITPNEKFLSNLIPIGIVAILAVLSPFLLKYIYRKRFPKLRQNVSKGKAKHLIPTKLNPTKEEVARTSQMIESRECCKLNGSMGRAYCNICGRVVPDEWQIS